MARRWNIKREKAKEKIFCWGLGPILMLLGVALGSTVTGLILREAQGEKLWGGDIANIIIMGALPWCLFLYSVFAYWRVLEISASGVRRSFLKVLFVKTYTWEEIEEIRVLQVPTTGGAWLFFSKESMEGMSSFQAKKKKTQIDIMYSAKLHRAIRRFTDKEIINAPDALIQPKEKKKDE